MKNSIQNICDTTPPLKWPPTSKELTLETANNIVPNELCNVLARTTGISNDLLTDVSRLNVDESSSKKKMYLYVRILSIVE